MKQTTLGALVTAEPALRRLCGQVVSVKAAYHFAKLARLIAVETEHYQAQRKAFIEELGKERASTPAEQASGFGATMTEVTPDNLPAFAEKMRELAAIGVRLTDWLLTLDLLAECRLSGEDMLALDPLLADGPPAPRQVAASRGTKRKQRGA